MEPTDFILHLLTTTLFIFLNALHDSIAAIDPEQAGEYHTKAFELLTEKYSAEKPQNMKNVEFDMIEIVSSFCDNLKCVQSAYQAAMEEIPLGKSDLQDVSPDSFDSSPVKYHLYKIESTIKSIDENNTDEVINELRTLQALLREDTSIRDEDKRMALAAGSVAIESTKLWTTVFRDPGHPLHVVQEVSTVSKSFFQHRKLQSIQTSGGTDLSYTILADILTLIAFFGKPFPSIFASLWSFAISNVATSMPSAVSSPSTSPSNMPTSYPTLFPTTIPTVNPTSVPSVAPSLYPTSVPSVNPTSVPSVAPSLYPTSVPTIRNPKKILAPDGAENNNFGFSVDICGDKVVVGAYGSSDGGTLSGSAYIFTIISTDIEFSSKLVPPDGEDNDNFGFDVAISDNTVVVGAYQHDNGKGAAYIFSTDGTLVSKLEANDGADDDNFGYSVAVYGDTVLVGAIKDDFENGSAYMFTTSGDFVRKLQGFTKEKQVRYGYSVAIGEDSLIVGVPRGISPSQVDTGSTYMYSSNGIYSLTLTASDGETEDYFGNSVAVSGDTLVVGANRDDDNGASSGSAYVYTSDGTFVTKIVAPSGVALANFGESVAIFDDIIVVGAEEENNENGDLSGAVYLFSIDGEFQEKIIAPDGASGNRFGCDVAISGDILVVGSFEDAEMGDGSGSSYIYFL